MSNSPITPFIVYVLLAGLYWLFIACIIVLINRRKPKARPSGECDLPPPGWKCTREKYHTGPCAAVAFGSRAALKRAK